jgi:hypothetical protein
MTYGEIMELIPVPKGTLAGWCKDIRLEPAQIAAIRKRRPPGVRTGIPVDTQRARREAVAAIRQSGLEEAARLIGDSFWTAGTALYWAEGGKTKRVLALANTDAAALRLFVGWVDRYLMPSADLVLALHLHEGNDEPTARLHWATQLGLIDPDFHKTYIKPRGTGHRNNRLPHGVCRVTVRRSADAWIRAMAWVEALARKFASPRPTTILARGR